MSVKRILYILPQPFYVTRGSSFRALATLEALSELGHEVDLLCFNSGPDIELHNLKIERVSFPGFIKKLPVGPSWRKAVLDIPLAIKTLKYLLTRRYDVIHGVEEAGMIAAFFGILFRKPYVFDMHSWMSEQLENQRFIKFPIVLNVFKSLEFFCMRKASAIITVGQQMSEILNKLVPNTPNYVLHDLPLKLPEKTDPESIDLVQKRYARDYKHIILYTGNFHSYQGLDLLIDSIGEIKKNKLADNFVLLIVGGSSGEASLVSLARERVAHLSLENEVKFCGTHDLTAVQAFIECATVLVSPRISGNNVPLKIYTYLASGKLLVATDISSHTQVLNSDNALLAQPDPLSFANGIVAALKLDNTERERLTSNAQKIANRKECFAKFKAVLEHCYNQIKLKYSLCLKMLGETYIALELVQPHLFSSI